MAKSKYYAVVTDLGNELMLQAVAEGKKVTISKFAVGDGNGAYYEPVTTMTQLKNEKWRGDINSCAISKESENVLIVSAICPGDAGGFTIREMAVFDDQNRMIAICNTPDTTKVKITDGVVNEMRLELEIILINDTSVELVIDPNIVTATKKDVEEVWDYLKETGKVVVGKQDKEIQDNDICVIVDEVEWPEKKTYLLVSNNTSSLHSSLMMYSDDMIHWIHCNDEINETKPEAKKIAYGNNRFVYIADGKNVYISKYGDKWERHIVEILNGFIGRVVYVFKQFWAISRYGKIFSSEDGVSWTNVCVLGEQDYLNFGHYGVIVTELALLALGYFGLYRTVNGRDWEKVYQINSVGSLYYNTMANIKNIYVFVEGNDNATQIHYSNDGIDWSKTVIVQGGRPSIFSANNRIYLAIQRKVETKSRAQKPPVYENHLLSSINGKEWLEINIIGLDKEKRIGSFFYVNGKYYCSQETSVYQSEDCTNWIKLNNNTMPYEATVIINCEEEKL